MFSRSLTLLFTSWCIGAVFAQAQVLTVDVTHFWEACDRVTCTPEAKSISKGERCAISGPLTMSAAIHTFRALMHPKAFSGRNKPTGQVLQEIHPPLVQMAQRKHRATSNSITR